MPDDKDGQVSSKSTCLQDQRDLDQNLARLLLSGTGRRVRRFGCAVGDHELDEEIHTDEGRQDTTRVKR